MTKNYRQGTVVVHPIALVIFEVFDDVSNQNKKKKVQGMVEDQPLKILIIKGNGKKGKTIKVAAIALLAQNNRFRLLLYIQIPPM